MAARRKRRPKTHARVLTDQEEELLSLARDFDAKRASCPAWGGMNIGAAEFLRASLRAEDAVIAWWTPDRWRRKFGRTVTDAPGASFPNPHDDRPTPQEIIRDLLTHVRPNPEEWAKLPDADAIRLITSSPIVFRSPTILAEMERLAVLKFNGEDDALDGIAAALKSKRRVGRTPIPIHQREERRRLRLLYAMDLSTEQRRRQIGRLGESAWPDHTAKEAAALMAYERYQRARDPQRTVSDRDLISALAYVDSLEKLARRHGYVQVRSSPRGRKGRS